MNFSFLDYFVWNIHALPIAAVSIIISFTGVFIFLQNRRSVVNISFSIICLAINFWLYGMTLVYSSRSAEQALILYRRIVFLGVPFISACVYWFSVAWLNLFHRQKIFVVGALLSGGLFYLAGLLTPYSFSGVYHYFWGYYPHYGPLNVIFLAYFFAVFFMAFVNFLRVYVKEAEPFRRKQIKLISIAFLISFISSIDFVPKLYHVAVYPIGFLCVFTWILMVGYSIVKYKAMEIETVIHQTLMWLATSSVVILPIAGTIYLLRGWYRTAPITLFTAFICALFFVGYLYLKTIQPHIDHFFKRKEFDLERVLIQFNDSLVHLKGLTELVSYIAQTIRGTLYVENIQIYLKSEKTGSLRRVDRDLKNDTEFAKNDPLIRWLEREDRPVLVDFIELDPQFQDIRDEAKRFFSASSIKVSVPLVLNREIIGLIHLDRKANLKAFRAAEIRFLSELRRAATIALSNSLRFIEMQESLRKWNEGLEEKVEQRTRELKEAQKQLVQAEKLATMGTLAGGVAHEINNPLTAVLTNAQILKLGELSPEDLESIELIEEGAKRCQEIVKKLMKYARKPLAEEPLKNVDVNGVVESVLGFLAYQLKQDAITIEKDLGAVHPIKGVPNELEQVITNIILNARDAIKAVRKDGTIRISTRQRDDRVLIDLTDNGKGIKSEHLSKIFDPFFTTKDVGKGTGLGLSIIYGIVEKHRGSIEVSSVEGQGSTFTVSFPSEVSHAAHSIGG